MDWMEINPSLHWITRHLLERVLIRACVGNLAHGLHVLRFNRDQWDRRLASWTEPCPVRVATEMKAELDSRIEYLQGATS